MENVVAVVSQLPREIVQGLIDRMRAEILKKALLELAIGITEGSRSSVWHISNRYYDADVELRVLDSVVAARDAPAIVLLLQEDNSSKTLEHYLKGYRPREAQEILIVADLYFDQTTTAEHIEAMESLCTDLSFEYIPIDAKWPGAEAGDRDGISRLRDALQLHRWPSLPQKHHTNVDGPDTNGFEDDFAPFQSGAPDSGRQLLSGDIDQLFAQLQGLRAQADLISDLDERHQFAEKVALAFEAKLGEEEEPARSRTA